MKTKMMLLNIMYCLLFIPFAQACGIGVRGSGNLVSETRNLQDFKGIINHTSADIFIKKGDTYSVKVEADDNILPLILTAYNGGDLEISSDKSFFNAKIKIYIVMPQIDKIQIHGSGNITGESDFTGNDLTIDVNGSGDTKFSFSGENLNLNIHGSGDLNLSGNFKKVNSQIHGSGDIAVSGKADDVEVSINGSGDFNGSGLESQNADISIHGSGDCKLNVNNKISGRVMGSGDIVYKGNASIVNFDRQGSGNIRKE